MNVAFFYPWALLGVVAIAVPVWLHLHRRREANLVLFSALRFLDDQPVARARPLWPRDLLLLLVRAMALATIVFAFAWPYVPVRQDPPLVTESVVVVFDNTLSHQAADRWAESRRKLLQYLESVPATSQTAVVLVDQTPQILKRFEEPMEQAIESLRVLSPGYGRGDYSAAVRLAGQLLERSLGQRRRLVLYLDHQANQWSAILSPIRFHAPTRIDVPYQENSPSLANLALWNGHLRRLSAGDESTIHCTLQLFHQGPATEATIEWSVNGTTLGSQLVPLDPRVRVVNLTIEFPAPTTTWVRLEAHVTGRPDALAADNHLYLCLPPVLEGRAEVWARSPYLRTALDPEVARGRWQVRMFDTLQETLDENQPLAEVLVAEVSQTASPAARRRLLNYRDSGRGILLVVNELSPAATATLHQWRIDSSLPRLIEATDGSLHLLQATHALLEPFADGPLGDLTDTHVYQYYQLNVPEGSPLLFSSDGTPILWELAGKGTTYVMAFPLDRQATDLPLSPLFVPFLDWCISTLRQAPEPIVRTTPGESFRWTVSGETPVRNVYVVGTGGKITQATVTNSTVSLTAPGEPGLFEIRYDDNPDPVSMLELNCPAQESELDYAPADVVQSLCDSWVGDRQEDVRAETVGSFTPSEASILNQRWWWWLMLAGVGLLLVESSLLAWRRKP